jgi:hypothetical protein
MSEKKYRLKEELVSMAIFIDAHVHIYPEYDRELFFTAAFDNFIKVAKKENLSEGACFVMALAEGGECDVFSSLYQSAGSSGGRPEKPVDLDTILLYKTEEPESLRVCKGEHTIFLLAGRQHVSKENIEILSLFSSVRFKDKALYLIDLAQSIADTGGLVVLPWGVGKWLGTRGEVVKIFLDSSHEFPLFIGDNGNRPSCWPTPSLFRHAHEKNILLLSGSDPLPLVSHCDRIASSGTLVLDGKLSTSHPADSLRKQLNQPVSLREFGDRLSSVRFVCDQFRINLLKRFR